MSYASESFPSRWRMALVILVFPLLAALAGAQTLAIIGEADHPDQAATIAPWDGSVRAHVAKAFYHAQLAADPATVEPPSERITALALDAYMRQPLVPEALAVIGAALPESDQADFWDAAASISRRDTLLQGLLLNFHLQNGNLDRAIRVLNQILQVRADQRRASYAALTQALRDSRSVDTFVDILGSGPDWGDGFLIAARRDKAALRNLALVRRRLPDGILDRRTDEILVRAFASSGELKLAYELYSRLSAQRLDETGGWSSEVPPFDWVLADEPGFRAQVIGGSQQLQLDIARGKGGVFAQRILPARSRSVSIRGQHDLQPQRGARLEIAVACVGSDGIVAQANLVDGNIVLNATLPPACGFIEISLSGRAWSDGQPIMGNIGQLHIAMEE